MLLNKFTSCCLLLIPVFDMFYASNIEQVNRSKKTCALTNFQFSVGHSFTEVLSVRVLNLLKPTVDESHI